MANFHNHVQAQIVYSHVISVAISLVIHIHETHQIAFTIFPVLIVLSFEFIAAFNSIILLSGLPDDVYNKYFREIWDADSLNLYKKMSFGNWAIVFKTTRWAACIDLRFERFQ